MTTRRQRALVAGEGALLAAAVTLAALSSNSGDWSPLWLVATLLGLAIFSDALGQQAGRLRVSGSFSALVLAMALLGPAPAVAIGIATTLSDALQRRLNPRLLLSNLAVWATFPLVGGLIIRWLAPEARDEIAFSALVFGVFLFTNALNFVLAYGHHVIAEGRGWVSGIREMFIPILPVECATGLLTAGVVLIEQMAGLGAIIVLALVVLVFQYMLGTALKAIERGHELEERNEQLASLQVGLISTMLKTLSLRDNMTARHSAAVARYAREMAVAVGLSEREQELIHTAGLFHDIGKFIFPDSILLADRRLSDADFEIVKRHPEVGAELIGEIEGYGPVAEVVLAHHERIDGGGYPYGLKGEEIPIGSRMIAVADTYDVITARDTYRTPVSIDAAFRELRRVAGTQLDAALVELFIELVDRNGIAFRHSTSADFEAELGLARRVRDYAAPRQAA